MNWVYKNASSLQLSLYVAIALGLFFLGQQSQ